jgi:hypothetical protein
MRTGLCCCAVASLLCGWGATQAQEARTRVKTASAPPIRHRWQPHCRGGWKKQQCQWVLELTSDGFGTQLRPTNKHGDFVVAWLEPGGGDPATFHGNDLHSLDGNPQPRQTNVLGFQLTGSGAILTGDVDGILRVLYGTESVVVPSHGFPTVLSDDGTRVIYFDNGVWETDLDPSSRQFSNPRELFTGPPNSFLVQFVGPDILWMDQNGSHCTVHFNDLPVLTTMRCTSDFSGDSWQLVWTEDFLRVMTATSSDGGHTWSAPVQVGQAQMPEGELYGPRVANGLVAWGEGSPSFGNVHTSDGRTFSNAGTPDISTFCGGTIVYSNLNNDGLVDGSSTIFAVPGGEVGPGGIPHIDQFGHVWSESRGALQVVQLACSSPK